MHGSHLSLCHKDTAKGNTMIPTNQSTVSRWIWTNESAPLLTAYLAMSWVKRDLDSSVLSSLTSWIALSNAASSARELSSNSAAEGKKSISKFWGQKYLVRKILINWTVSFLFVVRGRRGRSVWSVWFVLLCLRLWHNITPTIPGLWQLPPSQPGLRCRPRQISSSDKINLNLVAN